MGKETPNTTCQDSLCLFAERKVNASDERMRQSINKTKDQAGLDRLIMSIITKPKNFEEFEAGVDVLWLFAQEKITKQEAIKTEIYRIQPGTLQGVPLGKLPDIEQKRKYILPPTGPDLGTSMKKIFPPDISSRFLVVYKNYMKLDENLRRGIYQISKLLKIPHEDALGLMATESGFKRFAESGVGAKGLTQLMDPTRNGIKRAITYSKSTNVAIEDGYFASLRKNTEFMNIYKQGGDMENVAIGMAYYSYLLAHSDGRKTDALRKYNGGYGMPNVRENIEYPGKVIEFSKLFRKYMSHEGKVQIIASR